MGTESSGKNVADKPIFACGPTNHLLVYDANIYDENSDLRRLIMRSTRFSDDDTLWIGSVEEAQFVEFCRQIVEYYNSGV